MGERLIFFVLIIFAVVLIIKKSARDTLAHPIARADLKISQAVASKIQQIGAPGSPQPGQGPPLELEEGISFFNDVEPVGFVAGLIAARGL